MSRLEVSYNGQSFSCDLAQTKAPLVISNKEEGVLRLLFGGTGKEPQASEQLAARLSPGDKLTIKVVDSAAGESDKMDLDQFYLEEYYTLKKKLGS